MRKFLALLVLTVSSLPALAVVNVFATVPEWGALAGEIGGEQVKVYTATTALQDPHRIEARPSLLAQARRAQLLIATGAELEAGWLPVVQQESGNPAIQTGRPGYFEAAVFVTRLESVQVADRAHGDVHLGGNPHIHLDPRNILKVAQALGTRLAELDPANAAVYQRRLAAFTTRWQAAMARWEQAAQPLRGVAVVVHHKSFTYLAQWLGLKETGALEPKPGIEPTSGHLTALLRQQQAQPARLVIRAAYQQAAASRWFAEKAGIQAVMLPFTVGGSPEAGDLFGLFDDTIQRLLRGLR